MNNQPIEQSNIEALLSAMGGISAGGASPARTHPTTQEIVNRPHLHKPEVLKAVRRWRKEVWFPLRNNEDETLFHNPEEKFNAIKEMVERIASIYETEVIVRFDPGSHAHYNTQTQTITLNRPSVITALHELAHHLFGADELKACRWSVWLFKKTFPIAYRGLEFRGHMLVRPNETAFGTLPSGTPTPTEEPVSTPTVEPTPEPTEETAPTPTEENEPTPTPPATN